MAGNKFGHIFTLTTFGESHGLALGGVIDGCPAGVSINENLIQEDLDRRKPGQSKIVTQRKEPDRVEIYSGVFEGMTTGTPIGFLFTIVTKNQKITTILKMLTALLTQIMFMTKNMVFVIIVEVVEVLRAKQQQELLQVPLPNNSCLVFNSMPLFQQ